LSGLKKLSVLSWVEIWVAFIQSALSDIGWSNHAEQSASE